MGRDDFYKDALRQYVGAVDRMQRELNDVRRELERAAQAGTKEAWLQARANFYTLRANVDQVMQVVHAIEQLGDETMGVPGFNH